MTKEEAYKYLMDISYVFGNTSIEYLNEKHGEKMREAIETLKQEPCEMTAEEYRQRMIQAFHNADCNELIAICVLPTEKEFEHLEWLLKNHYKKETCDNNKSEPDAVSFKVDGDVVVKYEYTFGPRDGATKYKTKAVMTKEIFQECYEKWIKPQIRIVCDCCSKEREE